MDLGKDLVAASTTPLVLAILATGESYGYAIIKRVGELSGGHLQWTDGMLYPVLHRLERNGLVAARWGSSEQGRRRKYYRLTKEGRAELEAERRRWKVVDETLHQIWTAPRMSTPTRLPTLDWRSGRRERSRTAPWGPPMELCHV